MFFSFFFFFCEGLALGLRPRRVVDDGTAVIDCAHRVQRAPKTPGNKTHSVANKPAARIGLSIKVIGKVHRAYETRQVQVDELGELDCWLWLTLMSQKPSEVCKSRNEEPLHWRRVRELHRTNYDLKEKFVIPTDAVAPTVAEPATSSSSSSPVSSVANSPVKPAKVNSVVVSVRVYVGRMLIFSQDPPKLRHPSRLHSGDLTDNTFRIYVKHYMVYAPSMPSTPRPANSKIAVIDRSSRPIPRGFTLSYLRRVPELAEMARRVVMAEVKRRAKDQRKKGGEGRSQGSTPTRQQDKMGPKVKRLFRWAVVQLLHEGSIVLWDGAMRVCGDEAHGEVSGLWKTRTSISTSAEIGSLGGTGHDGDGNLTDPAADEEGYVPVTASFLGEYVEKVMNGQTKEGIVQRLQRDDRWSFIGAWQVQEALEYLQQESRAWQIGDRWALTS